MATAGGAGTASGGMSGGSSGGGFVPAAHPALPQVLDVGGVVLETPVVQPIVYSSDMAASDIESFLQELTRTTYWHETTSEYGVAGLRVLPTIVIATPPPATITDAAVRSMLTANTSGSNPAWGPADSSTIYLFVFPAATIESNGASGRCCRTYDGYHDQATSGSVTVAYAVSCACPGADGPNVTDLQQRTVDISHELVESATDPRPLDDGAYRQEDDADVVWTQVTEGEVADMCELNPDANYVPPGSTYMIQRSWSNAAAALVQDPCVPHTTSTVPYFNSFPALAQIAYPTGGPGFTTEGVNIPLGQSKTIDVNLFSAAPTPGPWTVSVFDYDEAFLGSAATLRLALDRNTGQNGDTLRLVITPLSTDATLGGEAFVIYSDYGQPGDPDFQTNLTMGLVTN
jgi:hypothetical protein